MNVNKEIPVSIKKLKKYLKSKYDIELEIDINFIDSIIYDKNDEKTKNNNKKKSSCKIKNNEQKEKLELEYYHQNIKLNNLLISSNYKYEVLYYDFYDLLNKYKILYNVSKIIMFNFKKIDEIIKNNKTENKNILLILNKTINQEKTLEKLINGN